MKPETPNTPKLPKITELTDEEKEELFATLDLEQDVKEFFSTLVKTHIPGDVSSKEAEGVYKAMEITEAEAIQVPGEYFKECLELLCMCFTKDEIIQMNSLFATEGVLSLMRKLSWAMVSVGQHRGDYLQRKIIENLKIVGINIEATLVKCPGDTCDPCEMERGEACSRMFEPPDITNEELEDFEGEVEEKEDSNGSNTEPTIH